MGNYCAALHKSKRQYRNPLKNPLEQLSSLQEVRYVADRYALVLNFPGELDALCTVLQRAEHNVARLRGVECSGFSSAADPGTMGRLPGEIGYSRPRVRCLRSALR